MFVKNLLAKVLKDGSKRIKLVLSVFEANPNLLIVKKEKLLSTTSMDAVIPENVPLVIVHKLTISLVMLTK
jgi:hypothetical protein